MKVPCFFGCGQEVDTGKPGVFLYVSGWAEQRADGGTHALRDRRVTEGRAAHRLCLDEYLKGGTQRSIFDEVTPT